MSISADKPRQADQVHDVNWPAEADSPEQVPLESSTFTSFRSLMMAMTGRDRTPLRSFALAAFAALSAGFMSGCGAQDQARSQDGIIGTWRVLSVNSIKMDQFDFQVFWTFDEEVTVADDTGHQISQSRYRIDTTQHPKHFDMEISDIDEEQRAGIYEINGPHLRISQAVGGGERPANFDEGTVTRFERVTANAAKQDAR